VSQNSPANAHKTHEINSGRPVTGQTFESDTSNKSLTV